ncbi:sensor domain-containing diguanylate cyclase [Sporomusa sp.]|uniref:sensor domain-containing diguanylate cyclase n=1 Tax=Sporomusa sp. TaxID=2078658 RepID=UPI002BE4DCF5|nr:diguanylate cyclase [Sporomusa sp.]HWR43406.1 diguanylate cyclase [Sporomusa sp.]
MPEIKHLACSAILEAVMTNVADGIRIVDTNQNTIYWNNAAQSITGYSATEMQAKPCFYLFNSSDSDNRLCEQACPLKLAAATNEYSETQTNLQRKSGNQLAVKFKAIPVRNDAGQVVAVVEIFNALADNSLEKIQALSNLAFKDNVTELHSHQYAELKLTSLLEDLRRSMLPFGVLIFQITNLKAINDKHGTIVGDQTLRLIAEVLSAEILPPNIVSRWQSAAFLVTIQNTRKGFILPFANKIKLQLEQMTIMKIFPDLTAEVCVAGTIASPNDSVMSLFYRLAGHIKQSDQTNTGIYIDIED